MSHTWKALAIFAALSLATAAGAVEIGMVDDMQDGTTQNWTVGAPHPSPPFALADAGPAGVGDFAVQLDALGGGGPGSRLAIFNRTQWAGDWTAAGVTAIQVDLKVVGSSDLNMRLGLQGDGGRFVTDAVELVGDGTWQQFVIPVTESDLISAGGTDAAATLAGVFEFRFLHNPDAAFQGAVIAESVLIDNVTALPEPGALAMLGLGALLALRRR